MGIFIASIFLILIVIVYLFFKLYPSKPNGNIPLSTSSLQTGDLLFLSGKTYPEGVFRCISECPYNHVCMIIRISSGVFVLEADIGQGYRSGIRVLPLDIKLKRWKGYRGVALRRLNGDIPLLEKRIVNAIQNDRREMDELFVSWIFKKRISRTWVFCSEFIAELIGMSSNPVEIDPGWIFRDEEIPYDPPIHFTI